MTRIVNCIKFNSEEEGLDCPPFPGPLGDRIWKDVSKKAWSNWLKYQTMLINENRLNMGDIEARQYLLKQIEKYFYENDDNIVTQLD